MVAAILCWDASAIVFLVFLVFLLSRARHPIRILRIFSCFSLENDDRFESD